MVTFWSDDYELLRASLQPRLTSNERGHHGALPPRGVEGHCEELLDRHGHHSSPLAHSRWCDAAMRPWPDWQWTTKDPSEWPWFVQKDDEEGRRNDKAEQATRVSKRMGRAFMDIANQEEDTECLQS
mmetsp:Transcript_16619/g.36180  ORF Transcript_16619/g.36180 Transcript_16619/m.36180 type:complete len:127 (-) Transcript_16619:332-712(-)